MGSETVKYAAARLIVGLVLVVVWALARADANAADVRVAMVVGNAAYKSAPLKNPVNDARAIARALQEVGFEVDLQENLSQQGFVTALRNFGKRLNETGGTGLFYYAGHGMQVKGANYLIPVDAGIESEDEVKYMAINANQVLDKMDSAGNRLNIVILDACRDNPFARSFRSRQSGLAQMDAPSGMLIAFATAPGAVAYDGDGVNGVYTKHLLRNLGIPGLPVELVLKRVREGVSKETGSKQIPWESSSLLGDFYFTGDAASTPAATAGPVAIELAFWNSVKDSGLADEYAAYLNQFPNGRFVALAKSRLNIAKSRKPVVAATTAQPEQIALVEPGSVSAPQPREIGTSAATISARDQTARPSAPTPALPPGATFTDCPDCPEMVVVPAGRFTMGSPAIEAGRANREGPTHKVTIAADFAVSKFEITRGQFARFVNASGHDMTNSCWQEPEYMLSDQHPVVCVYWKVVKAFAKWLADKTGKPYRLLSEAEWEYAARATSTTSRFWGDDLGKACDFANVGWCGANGLAQIGQFKPNAFGLHDMLGNAWEWVEDCWNDTYTSAPKNGSAWLTGNCGRRVLRGGSWVNRPDNVRSADRSRNARSYRFDYYYGGMRLARTLP